jgi:hypothetical protein
MNYPLQSLLKMGVLPTVTFPTDSRYYGSGTLTYTAPDGTQTTYLARRFVPQAGAPNYVTVGQYSVQAGDRLDMIAAKYLGDPLMFWLICDANGAMDPDDLVATPGSVLSITMPANIAGGTNA